MKRWLCSILIGGYCLFPVRAEYPSLVMSGGITPILLPGTTTLIDLHWAVQAEGAFSLRTLLGEAGYFALLLSARGGIIMDDPLMGLDEELLSLEAGLPMGAGRLVLKALDRSSFLGTAVDETFHLPEWEIKYLFLTETGRLNPYAAYNGFVRLRPGDNTDVFSEKGEIGFEYRPSYLEEYRLSLSGAWEGWYEYPLLTSSGGLSGSTRNDFLGALSGKAGGIIDFFFSWDVELSLALRLSSANAYLATVPLLDERSENALTVSLNIGIDWSPLQAVTVKLKPQAAYKIYFERLAVAGGGGLLAESIYVFSAGGVFEFDWAPSDLFHFFIKLEGRRAFSNEAAQSTWQAQAFAGLRLSFDLSGGGD